METDLQLLLNGLQKVWTNPNNRNENMNLLLNKEASKVKVDDFVGFKKNSAFLQAVHSGMVNVFHYGVLVYDNYSITNKTSLIPFKYAYSKLKDPLEGLNATLGQSESNVRDFLFGNNNNAEKMRELCYDGFLLFSRNLDSNDIKWTISTNTGEHIELDDVEELWTPRMGVLNIFKKCIFEYNGVKHGTVYTAMKIIDIDIEGRSSSYLTVNSDNKKLIEDFISAGECQRKILLLVSAIRSLYTKIHSDTQKREAEKSAKAAIMSRNLSHNLGSHVMFYIKQKLESVSSIFKEGTLERLIQAKSVTDLKKQLGQQKYDDEMPFLVGLGRFVNYLQERQDYIATVATGHIPYRTTINFKDAIYDELKPEKRSERHIGDKDAKDRKAANLLLDYIAYSEGFSSSDKIELMFRKDGIENNNHLIDNYFDGSGTPNDVPERLRDFNVSLPGGNLGRQAFFSIMENIIRNTAKHEVNHIEDNKITFFIDELSASDIKDVKDQYSWRAGENELYNKKDNITNSYEKCENDLHYLGITVKLKSTSDEINTTLDKIRAGLHQSYLVDGQIDDNCKGLKEIRISSAWIRGVELDDTIPDDAPPAVAIRKTDEGYLQYIICLPKPKRIAVISNTRSDKKQKPYVGNGCKLFSAESVEENDEFNHIADYDLVVCERIDKVGLHDDGIKKVEELYNKVQSRVGARIFRWKDEKKTIEDAIADGSVYKEWIRDEFNITNEEFPQISILDDKVCDRTDQQFVKVSGTSQNDESYYNNCIVFNTHYSGQPYKSDQDRLLYSTANYVGTISGGNSTDRLIRREKRDLEWYAKHVAAGKTKVAVFDERIYEMIMPQNCSVEISEEEIKNIREEVELYSKEHKNASPTEKIRFVQRYLTDREVAISTLQNSNNKGNGFADIDALSNKIIELIGRKDETDYSKAWKYREGGVWAFDIKIINNTTIQIVGYNAPIEDPIGLYSPNYHAKVLATILKDEKDVIRIKPKDNKQLKKFDFITIHQGVLDKIYNTFDVTDANNKKKVTEQLFNCFSIKEIVPVKNKNNEYEIFMPQFIIHSGRSKPNSKDMPQHQPFLQFSALDHAIRDCKYALTELLYSAHYEESNNNH